MKPGPLALVLLLTIVGMAGRGTTLQAAVPVVVLEAEKLSLALDQDGREPELYKSRDARAEIARLGVFVPQLESYCARHPRDARALVALARLRSSQIQFETVGAPTGAPVIHADQTGLDPVIPLLDSALVIDPHLASAWFWKARLIGQTSFYRRDHRIETLSMIQPDNERALPAAARAVQLAPDHPLYRALYESLLAATGRTEEQYRAHPLADRPWREDNQGSLAGLEEDWAQVPIPAGAVLLSTSDLLGTVKADSGSAGRRILRMREYAVPNSALELEQGFAVAWPGFAWKQLTAGDLADNPLGALLAPALSDTSNGRVRMFEAELEWHREDGSRILRLPWGEGPLEGDAMMLLATELTGRAGGTRTGELASIHTDPYCILKLANVRALPR